MIQGAAWGALNQSRETPVVRAVRETSPAVVNISTVSVVEQRGNPFPSPGGDEMFRRFFEDFFEPSPRRQTTTSLGSGVIIDGKRGYIVTNQHVVMRASSIQVYLATNEQYEAKVVGADPESDLAVLKIDAGKELPEARMGTSSDLMIGETIIAIGNPFGFSHTVTTGVVSAVQRSIKTENRVYHDFIQTDAPINPGNSGGPLLNINGELIGINTAIYYNAQGIGFAIPIDRVRKIVDHLIRFGQVRTGWIGMDTQDLTKELSGHFPSPDHKGALVARIVKSGPAYKAGLRQGDVVTAVDGQPVQDKEGYDRVFSGAMADTVLEIDYYRSAQEKHAQVTAEVFPEALAEEWFYDVTGLRLEERTDYGRGDDMGMRISMVRKGSVAAEIGLQPGDIIREINEITLSDRKDLIRAIVMYRHKGPATFVAQRGRYGYRLNLNL